MKKDFYHKMHIFLENRILFSFIECTILWDVNSQLLISFEDLQTEYMIKIWSDPPKGDVCHLNFL